MGDERSKGTTRPAEAGCEAASRSLFKRILLLVTGIRGYEEVVRDAGELATAFGAQVIALYVLDQNKVRQLAKFSSKSLEAVEAVLEEDGWTYLYYTEQQLLEMRVPVHLRFEEGSVVDKVVEVGTETGADLLVTQQPSEKEDRTFRSYLPAIIDRVSCAVMIVNT